MWIKSKAEYVWSDRQNKYILFSQKSIFWTGPVTLCKGASPQQTAEANASQQFTQNLQQDYAQQFQNQNAILNSINSSLSPILQGGINQYGYSPAEERTLTSQALQGTGQQYAGAQRALAENQAAAGGGNVFLPSGVNTQQQAQLAASAANQASNQLLGIKQQGYELGRQNYLTALGGLSSAAGMYNPTGYAGQATSAGQQAFNQATSVYNENMANSPWNLVGGLAGAAAGAFLGPLGSTLGSAAGKGIAGLFTGGASSSGGSKS